MLFFCLNLLLIFCTNLFLDFASAVCSKITKIPDIVSAGSPSSFIVNTLDSHGGICASNCNIRADFLNGNGMKLENVFYD
jgi:hypothetical protein